MKCFQAFSKAFHPSRRQLEGGTTRRRQLKKKSDFAKVVKLFSDNEHIVNTGTDLLPMLSTYFRIRGGFADNVVKIFQDLKQEFAASESNIKRGYAATLLACGKRLGTPLFYRYDNLD